MKKLYFETKNKEELKEELKTSKRIFNFLNLYSVYLFKKNKDFAKAVSEKYCINSIDGAMISVFLSLKKVKKIKRLRGTDFIRYIMNDEELLKNKRHLFLGSDSANEEGIKNIASNFKKIDLKKVFYYNPPYIKEDKFPEKEIKKICDLINKKKIDYVWVGLGNPKQEIIAKEIFNKTNAKGIFCVGGALDFLSKRKKEAPKIIRKFYLEWFYRLLTDFKHSKKKVWRSFEGLFYMPKTITTKDEK